MIAQSLGRDTENTEIFDVFALAVWCKYPSIVIIAGQGGQVNGKDKTLPPPSLPVRRDDANGGGIKALAWLITRANDGGLDTQPGSAPGCYSTNGGGGKRRWVI
jgi:hypothetical protein